MGKTTQPNTEPSGITSTGDIELHKMRYRWVMLGLLWLLYFSFGVVTRSSFPLVTPIIKDLDMSYGQMGFVLGSWQMTYIVLAIMAGIIMDRWGIKRAIFAGALIISLSATLRAFSTGFVTFLLFVALFGAGGPMISIGCPKTIALWFKGKDRGTAVGIYTTGPWIGGMLCLAGTNAVVMPLMDYSWRMTFACYGAMAFVLAMVWWFFAKDANTDTQSEHFNPIQVLADLVKVPNVCIILVCGLLSFGIVHGFSAWLPKILEAKGYSSSLAGIGAATPFIASIPAVLIIPRSVPAYFRGKIIALLALLCSISVLWVVAIQPSLLVGLLVYGATSTCLMPLLVLTLMETPEVASKYLGSATGVFFCVSEVGGFLGPFIVGYLVDVTGGFFPGALFMASLGIIIFALMFFLATTHMKTNNRL